MDRTSLILSLLVLLFPSIYISATTYQYKCADELKIDTCYLETKVTNGEDTEITYYGKRCSKNKKCNRVVTDNEDSFYQCTKINKLKEIGDSCNINEECHSNYCSNNKCAYLSDGQNCSSNQLCQKNSICKYNDNLKPICTRLSSKDSECNNSDECEFGLLCNKALIPSKCTEMFSLENGIDSSEDFLCKSGRKYDNKCASSKIFNSTCSSLHYEEKCEISYNNGEGDQKTTVECEGHVICPLQTDSQQMKDYIMTFTNELNKMKKEEIQNIHMGDLKQQGRFTLNGNKNVVEAYVNLMFYKIIEKNECVKDFTISLLKGYKNDLSFIVILWLVLLL